MRTLVANYSTWQHHRVELLKTLALRALSPVEPIEYCKRWIKGVDPNSRGYRKTCIEELAKATKLSKTTIKDWGEGFESRPSYVLHILAQADKLNQIRELVGDSSDSQG
jgi:hypothetical protein